MANSDKNIRITTNNSTTSLPKIAFTGQNNSPITLYVLDDNTLSFEGSAGQLFSINNVLSTGYIFSINDISGIPSLRINADGTVGIAEFTGNVGIGLTNPTFKFQTNGSAGFGASIWSSPSFSSSISGVTFNNGAITSTGVISSTGRVSIQISDTAALAVKNAGGTSILNVDTTNGITSVLSSTGSTSTTTGALVITGGVGIGQSVNVGGRVGIGTNLLTGQINIRTSSASTPAIVVQGSASQTADYAQFFTSTGTTSLSIDKDGKITFPIQSSIQLFAEAYSSTGRIRTSGPMIVYGAISSYSDGINESYLNSSLLYIGGLTWTPYSSGATIRWSTPNAVRIQPTSTSVVPLVVQLQNASWTSGNAFEIQNNSVLKFNVDYAGNTSILSTAGSASTTTGALVVSGGVGIGGSVIVGGRVGIGTVPNLSMLNIQTSSAGTTGLSIIASSSQSAPLLEWWSYGGIIGLNQSGRIKPTGELYLGIQTVANLSSGTNPLFSLQGRGATEGMLIKGFNSGASEVIFEVQGNTSAQLFGIYGDGGVNAPRINVTNSTGSTSTTTGALVVTGGVGIGQSLFTSSSYASSISGVILSNGSVTLSGTYTQSNSNTAAFVVKNAGGTSILNVDTTNGITSVLSSTGSTSTTTGALVITGGVGIGGSINIGGRVGIGTNLLSGQLNIVTSTASTPGIVVQGSTSQTADYAQFFTSTGTTSLSITKDAEIKFPLAQDIKLYATPYASVGAIKTTGNFFALGGLIFAYGVSDSLSGSLSPTQLLISGLDWTTYSSGSSIRWATNNPVRIQPTGTSVVPLHINLNNASWTSGNAFEIANNGDLRFSVDYTGSTRVLSTVGSASTTTGALVVYGGVGIGGSLNVSSASLISGVTLNTGVITGTLSGYATTSNNIRITGAGNFNSNHLLTFTPSSSSSGSAISSDSTLSFNPSTEILSVSGLAITATTASSSTSNGALQVAGGVGISGRLSFNQAAFGTTGIATNPTMAMIGSTGDPIYMSVLEDNSISFEGSQGQLFSITPNLSTGYIYSVNDITGIPLLRANANANVTANEYAGNFGIGLSNPGYKLHVVGSVGFTSTTASTSTTTGTLVVSGGVGIGGSLYVNSPSNISSVIINNGVITGNLTGTATTSGFATTASYSHQAGYAITAGSATTAITAVSTTSVSVASAGNSNLAHPILITNNPSSGSAVSSDNTFTFNPSTEVLSVSGIAVTSSTGSSNTTTGALVVSGGVGIGGSFNVGNKTRFNDEVTINSLSSNALTIGGSGSVAYTWAVGTTLSANRFNLGLDLSLSPIGGNQSVVQSYWGLQLAGNTGVVSTSFTPTSYGSAGAIGVLVPNQQSNRVAFGIVAHASQTADLQIWTSSTASTSSPYLAVKADGQIYSYANIPATSFSSGALVVSGGVGIGGSLFVNGDLTINGTTTTINSVTLSVDDKNIELGSVSSPSDVTAEGGGITLKGSTDKIINWYSGVGWSSSESWNLGTGNTYKINNASVLTATTLGTGVTNSSLTSLGTITSGVWAGTLITANYGGVGLTTPFTVGDILYANTSTTWGRLTTGTSGHLLSSTGIGSTPSYVNPITLTVGSATTASNLRIANANSNLSHPILFTPSSSTSGSAVSSDSTFSFNSSTEILSVSGLAVTSTTSSSGSTTGALTVAGGVGIGGTVNIAGDVTVLGRLYYSQSTVGVAGTSTIPSISFIGQDNNPITLSVLTDNTLSFEGSSGQLFSINNNLSSGTIFSVNDISGIPILRANANGTLSMGEFSGNVGVGLSIPSYKLHVSGSAGFSGTVYITGNASLASNTASTSTTTGALVVAGGVGIGGSLYVASATAISGVTINAGVITGSLTGTASTATYAHQSGYATTSGFATSATSASIATTSYSVNVNSASTNANHFLIFSPNATGSGVALSTESALVYNPSTDILSVSGLAITSGTASTTTSTGALIVSGGVGIGGSLHTSTSVTSSVSGLRILNGSLSSATSTIAATNKFQISVSDTAAFTVKNGGGTNVLNIDTTNGISTISSSTGSTNTSTGALVVTGSVGVGGTLNVNSVVTYNKLQNQSFSGASLGSSDGRSINTGILSGHDIITYGNGLFVTTSSWGAYNSAYSTDGISWTASSLPVNQGYPVSIYGNGYFVLAATGATNVLYSANGTSWSQVSIGNTFSRTDGAYGNGKYVIVGTGQTYNYSSNLTTWTSGTLPITGNWRIAYGNGVFVALGYGTRQIIYSYDGIYWNLANTKVDYALNWTGLKYANGRFIASVYSGGGSAYSLDGINWYSAVGTGGENLEKISYGNGVYFVSSAGNYYTSGDGTTYNNSTPWAVAYQSGNTAYGLGKFQAIGRFIDGPTNTVTIEPKFTGEINNVRIGAITPASGDFTNLSSTGSANLVGTVNAYDLNIVSKLNQTPVLGGFAGSTGWTSAGLLAGTAYNYALAFGNGLFVQIRKSTNYTSFSPDGRQWVGSAMPFTGDWMSIAWGVDKFVAVASAGTTGAYSGNGISWTSMSMPATAQGWYAVTYGDDKFVAVGNTSTAAYSSDGITWSGSSIANTNWTGVAYGNGTFVAVSGFGISGAYSYDGINWNLINLPTNGGTGIKFITYGNGYFIVTNYVNNDINYSRDGINWSTTVRTSTFGIKTDIAYGNGIYSIFNYQEAAYSYDGVSWLLGNTIAATDWQAVAYGNNRFVATSINTSQVGSIDGPSNTLNLHPKFTGDIDNVRIGAKQPAAAEFTNLAAQQPVRFTANTASININTGALVVVGGVGIGQTLFTSSSYASSVSGVILNNGTITGTVSGYATTSNNIRIAGSGNSNLAHPVLFTPSSSSSGSAVSSDNTFFFNPFTEILSVSGLAVTASTASTSPTTGALIVTGGVGVGATITVGLGISVPIITSGSSLLIKPGTDSTNAIQFTRTSSALPVLTLDTLNSRVGIGVTNPEYDLEVNGEISATTKSFLIPHPTKENMKLRYGSLEGPENGVYIRGELKDSNEILLPDYWEKLVDHSTITIHLTPIGNKTVFVKEIRKDKVIVGARLFQKIHCFYSIWAERKDVPKLKVEF